MTYLVNQTNGTLLATVPDGAVDTTHAGISLIGRQVTNYGEIQNENFVRIAESFSSPTSPANPLEGQIWWNSSTNVLSAFDGTTWQLIGPISTVAHANIADLATTANSATISTTSLHAVSADIATNANVAISSTTAATASNALMLDGHPASYFMTAAAPGSTTPTSFPSTGLLIGSLALKDESGTAVIENQTSSTFVFRSNLYGSPTDILKIEGTNLVPVTTMDSSLGSPSQLFNAVYAANLVGVSSAAKYADLAEKYLADAEYDVGTVLIVGGEKEVTKSALGKRAIGVVSLSPAYLMNSELEGGICVALKGRVPVKVFGAVTKGDYLRGSDSGCAIITTNDYNGFAVALETNTADGIKLVECLIL